MFLQNQKAPSSITIERKSKSRQIVVSYGSREYLFINYYDAKSFAQKLQARYQQTVKGSVA